MLSWDNLKRRQVPLLLGSFNWLQGDPVPGHQYSNAKRENIIVKVGNRENSEPKKHGVGAGRSQAELSTNLKKSEEMPVAWPTGGAADEGMLLHFTEK